MQKGLAAGEMDAGLPVPPADRAQEVVGDFGKLRKGKIRLFGKIFLVAMTAAQVAEIGEVPLDIKIFHEKMVAEAPADGKEERSLAHLHFCKNIKESDPSEPQQRRGDNAALRETTRRWFFHGIGRVHKEV